MKIHLFFLLSMGLLGNVIAQQSPMISGNSIRNAGEFPLIKIAVMLPFYAESEEITDTLVEIPSRSKAALELFEGLETALNENEEYLYKTYYIKVLDTRRDVFTVENQLRELENFKPDIVIGEIYNRQTRLISEWAEKNGVVHIVPLSPTRNLIEGKNNVFLLNPSTFTHGKKMAEYAFQDLGLRSVVIWSDGRSVTNDLVKSFENQFRMMGGYPRVITIDSVFEKAQAQINQFKNEMASTSAVYIPINNEEILGLLFSIIDMQRWKLKVMTLPDVENFDKIDLELKEHLGIYFSNAYNPDEESEAYLNYLQQHLLTISSPPTSFHIQGYDLGTYLLQVLESYSPEEKTIVETLKDFIPVETLHGEIKFERERDNQGVTILQMTSKGIIQVK
jgi:ABC-type branched-subunit amino acid transport system substrate-binding protein